MHVIDFLAVENEDSDSTKSGDAVAMKFTDPGEARTRIVVIDSGYAATGQQMVDHVKQVYGDDYVDLVISTHPDKDHLNGLKTVLEQLRVGELMMHLPWEYRRDATELSNYEAIVELYDLAVGKGITITEPFTGVERFSRAIRVIGPTKERYVALLDQMVDEAVQGVEGSRYSGQASGSVLLAAGRRVLEKVRSFFPTETLGDDDDASPRNQSSAITLLTVENERLLFTGDSGIESLNAAADYYELTVGSFAIAPVHFFQAPHHGSKHNLGKTILNRMFGQPDTGNAPFTAFISSAKASEKHPSPKVTNALGRRGARVFATEGTSKAHGDWSPRAGWSAAAPLQPLDEDDD